MEWILLIGISSAINLRTSFGTIVNPIEMAMLGSIEYDLNFNSENDTRDLFNRAFNIDYIDSVHVAKAIAAQFERTLVPQTLNMINGARA